MSPNPARRLSVTLCLVAMLAASVPLAASGGGAGSVETLVLFDPTVPETPESIVFDRRDNAYISLAFTGEIRKFARDSSLSTLAVLPLGGPCAPRPSVLLGLAMDRRDRLYASVVSCNMADHGIWRIDRRSGATELVANMPFEVIGNGIDVVRGQIYVADTFDSRVWRVPVTGGTPEIWADDPLLERPPGAMFPGPNGLRFFRREIYVANSSTGTVVAIPLRFDGTAGEARIAATLPAPQGCDEFAFDVRGSIYCTTDPFNTVVRLDRDGTTEILLTADDLLDGPTSAAFGRRGRNRFNLYITNAAFPIFTTTFRPSLMRIRLDVPGAPFGR